MKALLIMCILIALPSGFAGWLFMLAGAGQVTFFQAFVYSLAQFILINCAVTLSSGGNTKIYVIKDSSGLSEMLDNE